jgi:methionyl-tRNA synthetase
MDRLALHEGAAAAFRLIDATNEFIAETAPWKLAKSAADAGRLDEVLFAVAEAVRLAAVLLRPVMPASAAEILRRVGETTAPEALRLDRDARWRNDGVREIAKGAVLWPRAEGQTVETRVDDTSAQQTAPAVPAPAPPAAAAAAPAGDSRISIDDFMKVDLRVAKVLEAEAVPKSKRLIKLTVDTGRDQRTIVAGIAEAYQPEQLVGRTIVIVANLQPATLMGIESNGMVLAGSPDGGKPALVGFDQDVPPGARVR